ncbi:large ribosomal subunit protein uL4 isoform X1 [Hydra vulgaris]|uniref:large ribosomal subunit protein uL4 isoform X1 n=1 Tax=Hydra vulgaris TaxID=6087 RepID=UPI001F5F59E9|nr:50S ribosomal protein L4-like [Hydra vulgaris]
MSRMMIPRFFSQFSRCLEIKTSLCRNYHHVRPVIKRNLIKPEVDLSLHDPHGKYSPQVREFIKARDFENAGGRKVDVISLTTGENKGVIELNNFVFGANPRIDILQRNVVWYRACIRAGTACTKTRGEVRGGGRKPWQQKGLGKARQGSIRAPHWRKGGVSGGPKPKDYSYELPFKVRRMGLRTALSCKFAQGDLTVVEDYNNLTETNFSDAVTSLSLQSSLFVDGFENDYLDSLVSGFEKIDFKPALLLHVYGMLIRSKLVLSLQAVRILEEKLCEDNRIVTDPRYELYHQNMLLDKSNLFKEFDPKKKELRGRLIPELPKKSIRHKLPMSRQDQ